MITALWNLRKYNDRYNAGGQIRPNISRFILRVPVFLISCVKNAKTEQQP